jgi:nicotinic acid mononucleotide adenylyltransferase|tara:strand:- start:7894 stop:8469 length:576 start_codon:yes stop_codon:yes gene_type:complete
MELTGIYPGSFNPPTSAHIEISEAAREAHHLKKVVWSVSRISLAKENVTLPIFEDRILVLHDVASKIAWLDIQVTDRQLLADIAKGYDLLIMGADKWHQIHDPKFYSDDLGKRDDAINSLPQVAVAPRSTLKVPSEIALTVPESVTNVSSSMARNGQTSMMLPEAMSFDKKTGAWTDQSRYKAWAANRLPD